MRNKRIVAALAGIALTGALATTFEANAATVPASRATVQQTDQTHALQQIHRLGLLGNLTGAVDTVARSANASPRPSAATLQSQVDAAKTAVTALQADINKPADATEQDAAQRSLQSDLAQLQSDLNALLTALASGNAAGVTTALTAIAADLVAIEADVTGTLGATAAAGD
jgi:hypothetical protein